MAKTPIFLLLVFNSAGLTPGSTPIMGMDISFLKNSIQFVVAVLQATIIILQLSSINFLEFLMLRIVISSCDLSPYGQFLLSER